MVPRAQTGLELPAVSTIRTILRPLQAAAPPSVSLITAEFG